MKHRFHSETASPGFQIAPMIDIVFVTMLLFMLMAGTLKAERGLKIRLPGDEAGGEKAASSARQQQKVLVPLEAEELNSLPQAAIHNVTFVIGGKETL